MSQTPDHDRARIERVYPREAHDQDAAENARPKATIHHGIRIAAPADKSAAFDVVRASLQVGESEQAHDALFLFPVRVVEAEPTTGYSAPEGWSSANAPERTGDAYDAFIARVLEAARRADFLDPIGADEERLRGPHGG